MNNIGGEGHIDDAVLHLLQRRRHCFQIERVVDLSAKQVLHVQRGNLAGSVQLVERVFRVDAGVPIFTETNNVVQPTRPVVSFQLVKRLRSHSVFKEVDADLHNLSIPNHGLEVLLRQRQC